MGIKMNVAKRLMNSESLALGKEILRIEYLPRDRIHKNPKNRAYSMDGIEELARDIRMCGLEQPLVVYQREDGEYMLLTGERRLTAIDILLADGKWDGEIPCIIRSLDEYGLPINDDLKERYAILRTNAFNRKMTDADLMRQAMEYREIILALKKAGFRELPIGYDGDGNLLTQNIRGRIRKTVADLIGVSTGQISKIEYIEKHGIDETKDAVRSGKLDIADGARIAALPEEQQADAIQNPATVRKNAAGRKKPDDSPSQKEPAKAAPAPKCAINGTFSDQSMERSSSADHQTNDAADGRNPLVFRNEQSSNETPDKLSNEGISPTEAKLNEEIEKRRFYDEAAVDRIIETVRSDLVQLFSLERSSPDTEKPGEKILDKIILLDALMKLKAGFLPRSDK